MNNSIPIENKLYQAINPIISDLETYGIYKGNSHHLSQKLSFVISISLLSKQQRLLFDCLNTNPKSAKSISQESGIASKNVSSILNEIYNKTLLIGFERKGKLKYYFKTNTK